MADGSQIDVKVAAQIGEFLDAVNAMTAKFKEMSTGAARETASVESSFQKMTNRVKDLVGAIAGIEIVVKIKEMIDSQTEFAEKLERTSQKTGMSVESLQTLAFTGNLVGVSFDQIAVGMRGLAMSMSAAQSGNTKLAFAFKQVGISVNDLKTMKPDEVLAKMADSFHAGADGSGKMQVAIELLKRSGLGWIPLLNMGSAGMKEMADVAQKLGVVMGDEDVAAMARAGIEMKLIGSVTDAMKKKFVADLVPAIESVISAFRVLTEKRSDTMNFAEIVGGAMKAIAVAGVTAYTALKDVGLALAALAASGATMMEKMDWKLFALGPIGAALAIGQAAKQSSGAISSIYDGLKTGVEANSKEWSEFLAKIKSGDSDLKAIAKRIQELTKGGEGSMGGQDPTKTASELADFRIKMVELVAAKQRAVWDMEVAEGKKTAEERAEDEESLQKRLSAAVVKLMNEKAALYADDAQKYAKEKHAITEYEQKAATDAIKARTGVVKAYEDVAKQQREIAQKSADDQVKVMEQGKAVTMEYLGSLEDAHQISALQRLQTEREMDNNIYAATRELKEKVAALWKDDPVKYKEMTDALDVIDAKHNADLAKNARAQTKEMQDTWIAAVDTIKGAFDTMLVGILQGTQTWQQTMMKLWNDLAATFIKNVGAMMVKWLAFEALGIGTNPFGAGGISLLGVAAAGLGVDPVKATAGAGAATAAASGGTAVAGDALEASMAANTAATAANSSGITGWISNAVSSIAQTLGLTTATTANTVAVQANTLAAATSGGAGAGLSTATMAASAQTLLPAFEAVFAEIEAAWEASEALMTTITSAAVAERVAIIDAGLVETGISSSLAAFEQASAFAASAAVAAMASVAAIPLVGWAMAPGVGAETYAAGMMYAAMTALATGTNYVPKDMPAYLHEGEAVVPKRFNPAAGGQGAGGNVFHFHVSATDSRDVERALMTGGALHKTLRKLARNGTIPS